MDYPSDRATYLDDGFEKGAIDFRVAKVSPDSRCIEHSPGGPSALVRRYKVKLSFTYNNDHRGRRREDRTLKVKWRKLLNAQDESWTHSMSGTEVPNIWAQVKYNVEHDVRTLEGE